MTFTPMFCKEPDCDLPVENHDTGLCSSHGRLKRKEEAKITPYSYKEQSINRPRKGNLFKCSDGAEISDSQIKTKLSQAYKDTPFSPVCLCCGSEPATEHDHTVAKARCKVLHKTELVWDRRNWSDSCRSCHSVWEQYKSGEFAQHLNVIERMIFLREHDFEGFKKRLPHIEDERVREAIL